MEDLHGMRKMYKMGLDLYLKDYEFPDLEELLKNAIDELHNFYFFNLLTQKPLLPKFWNFDEHDHLAKFL